MSHEAYYTENTAYTDHLAGQDLLVFEKYLDYLCKFSVERNKLLDVGCGPGLVLQLAGKKAVNREIVGIDISAPSVEFCNSRGFNCKLYNGRTIPFEDNYFDVTGSIDVLEHVNDPVNFLNEKFRVLKKEGCLLIVCPNFLSVTNSYHHHTAGGGQKIKNLISIISKTLKREYEFEKMDTIERKVFQSDDDACNVTNPIDILKWSKTKELKLVYWSGQTIYKEGIINIIDLSICRLFLGSSFFVFRK